MTNLLWTLLALASCSANAAETTLTNSSVQEEAAQDYIGPIIHNLLGEKQDPTITFNTDLNTLFMDTQSTTLKDRGLLVTFEEIPGQAPYHVEQRRLLQENPNSFYPVPALEEQLNILRSDEVKVPWAIMLFGKHYAPGERIAYRITSQEGEILKETICCPNPLVLKNSDGEVIMEAALLSFNRPNTTYALVFPPRKEDIEYIFTVGSKQVKGKIPAGGLKYTTFEPVLEGIQGGIAKIELCTETQNYLLELPWGHEIINQLHGV